MKTLIIIAIILFFAWLYRKHQQFKQKERELVRYQEETPEYDDTGQRIKKEDSEVRRAYFGKLSKFSGKKKFVKTGRNHNY